MKNEKDAIKDLKLIKKELLESIPLDKVDKLWAIDYAIEAIAKQLEQKKANNVSITVTCYGEKMTFESRNEAINFFMDGVANSDGSERARYNNILNQLHCGRTVCFDDEE